MNFCRICSGKQYKELGMVIMMRIHSFTQRHYHAMGLRCSCYSEDGIFINVLLLVLLDEFSRKGRAEAIVMER